jgi:hypothetical protein
MASANGVLSPQSQLNIAGTSPQPSAKRKRAESSEPGEQTNGTSDSKEGLRAQPKSHDSQQQIEDFVEILKRCVRDINVPPTDARRLVHHQMISAMLLVLTESNSTNPISSHDLSPSVLNRKLPTRESSAEPHPKRKKGELEVDTPTIVSRVALGIYSNLEDVIFDVKTVCSAMLDELHIPNGAARTQYAPISPSIADMATKVKVFRAMAEHILEGENAHRDRKNPSHKEEVVDATKPVTNGTTSGSTVTQLSTSPGDNKVVLTLYGNASGAKQLFSSLQQSVKAMDGTTDIVQPLREAGLPIGISTTQIVPLQAAGLIDEKKRVPTMGELFANSTSSPPFQPPKPSQIASTRSSIVGWYKPAELDRIRSRSNQSYFGQTITCGEWLDYAGTLPSVDMKRRQRERALSLGGGKVSLASTDSAELEASKLEALFRSAYSSFAPVKDDAAAIVPEGLVDRIWWQRVGEKSFERLVGNAANLASTITNNEAITETHLGSNERSLSDVEQIGRVIDEWGGEAIDPDLEQTEEMPKSIEDKEVDEILEEISELLETLNSYQRIRNQSLNPLPRSGSTTSIADPAKPSEAEVATYNTLKAQLTLMIAMLPPYAVAKLNSDQLAELNISTKIQVLTDNYKGVMEEDEAAARAKVAELRAQSSARPAPSTSLHRSSSSIYGNQYSASARPAMSGSQQYYSQAQTPIRTPSTNLQRPPATAPAPYPGQRQAPPPYRPQTTYSAPTYPHQLPRTSQSQYGQSNSQQYFQTPTATSYGQASTPSYGNGPQTSLSARYQAPSAVYHQTRAQNGMDYQYSNGNSSTRQTSPQKPAYSPQPQVAQPRPYGTPTPSISQDHRYFQSSMTNGTSTPSGQPQSTTQQGGNLGATGYHTVMTAEQQSTMMERQRAQLAQQQGTQQHARNAAQAGAMSVSPGPQVNGGNAVTAGH